MKKINLFLALQVGIIIAFFAMFCLSAFHMFLDPAPTDFVKTTFGELKTLFLGLVAWEALKKKAAEEAQKIDQSIDLGASDAKEIVT